ncbi:MAG: hypothetical protein KKD48_03795, partial [Nanoarchaeota archaeon]|nr:hypothetical protein [Nanoarchaeota archaeon]
REDVVLILSIVIFIVSLAGFISTNPSITGAVATSTVGSSVDISRYFSISASTNLSDGIYFGNISTLPATDVNATDNFNYTAVSPVNNATLMAITVNTDSNANVDFCIKANANLHNNVSAGTIPITGETYTAFNLTNYTKPAWSGSSTAVTTSYVMANYATGIQPGNSSNWRFWLDVPAATGAGTYNNTISFEGILNLTGQSCS